MQNTKGTKRENSQRISHNVNLSPEPWRLSRNTVAFKETEQRRGLALSGSVTVLQSYVNFWQVRGLSHLGPDATFKGLLRYPNGFVPQKNWKAPNCRATIVRHCITLHTGVWYYGSVFFHSIHIHKDGGLLSSGMWLRNNCETGTVISQDSSETLQSERPTRG